MNTRSNIAAILCGSEVRPEPCIGCPSKSDCGKQSMACMAFARYVAGQDVGDASKINLLQPSRQWFEYVFHDKDTYDERNRPIPAAMTEKYMLLAAAKASTRRLAA